MMIIGINGSPRKNGNTIEMLKSALDGAKAQGAETELINLYDYNYKGCVSCFSCKLKGGRSYGKCALKDDLKPILEKIEKADAFILASPIYFGMVTGEMRSFMERLLFQYLVYDKDHSSLFNRKIKTGFIYTMNVPETYLDSVGYNKLFESNEATLKRIFGASEYILSTDTYQFDDYSKYEASMFDVEAKKKRREEVFPEDCKRAYEMGASFVK
ncbi:multimeric flavodoxin WrbA [Clostridium acetobutylicum]|uniref:Multimeric flavodoxin (WrbA) domain containing protein n=1 Tax=Clostridium acetobutylicum (strain ATCC 824 / DSM 792 / JCM 1419 / IAM 19013 / LMG 5710 / NBRC 13948 / NRRL B-527 / VKM B-1787 / 2291 / W) TaxID=272562 RepID=Q97G50_CLOAB|nr:MULTISPECIES: flavodoxin family protein [Clostridium]AAK80473.1 Multimeric flavodoxin (WrbA) domain containing protein [Clostridium acetobutylicum ATCC 824]ADZ21570.1 Multimeric flavodoxin (WrbA) domain containing protein [Clostridium acetobutylicum EA 2018]AEI32406.1 multimeric flavodoxin domain-containing protein [Clostridium acetobutylicum DSM 1731]AWV79111.1 flavodoxin family protein [Clostridium acetobutylicum]MBC2394928.1 flavodoxin family protein [Clostridium acetobutylicum]